MEILSSPPKPETRVQKVEFSGIYPDRNLSYNGLVCDDNYLYFLSSFRTTLRQYYHRGCRQGSDKSHIMWKFNMSKRRWSVIPIRNMPANLVGSITLHEGRYLYVQSLSLNGKISFNVCDMAEKDKYFESVICENRAYLNGDNIFVGDKYYCFGSPTTGCSYTRDDMSLGMLDLKTMVWTHEDLEDITGRRGFKLAAFNNKVLIFGGISLHTVNVDTFKKIPFYDTETDEYLIAVANRDEVYGYPPARKDHSVVQVPNTMWFYIFGGRSLFSQDLSDVWRLDLITGAWKKINSLRLQVPQVGHNTVVTPSGRMYTLGNLQHKGEPSTILQAAWLVVPRLEELAWSVLTDSTSWTKLEDELPPLFKKRFQ